MGCGGSKVVSTVQGSRPASARRHSTKLSSSDLEYNNNHLDQAAEVAVFGLNDQELQPGPVNNAKPRLRSGIVRGRLEPITPSLETPNELPSLSFTSGADNFSLNSFTDEFEFVKPTDKIGNHTPLNFHLQPNSCRDEHSPFNTSRSISNSRASSAKTGSILTTTALNASLVTSFDGDELDIPLGTPHRISMDFDESTFRTTSITPSVRSSLEATPNVLSDKHFGPIIEEYEGGFTPRSIQNGEVGGFGERLKHYTYRDIYEHNRQAGWVEWCVYKRKIYHHKRLKEIFLPLVKAIREQRESEKLDRRKEKEVKIKDNFEIDDDDDDYDDDDTLSDNGSDYDDEEDDLEDESLCNTNGVRLLLKKGLDKATLESCLPPCCVGLVSQPSHKSYWDDVRNDVRLLLNDLLREDCNDKLSPYRAEFLSQLQRWIAKYRQSHPRIVQFPIGTDLNENGFPLPEEIKENPDCLRQWIESWEPLDVDVPETGAWKTQKSLELEIGDPHETFAASLRPYEGLPPLDMTIEGETAWEVIPLDLIANDVMTEEQLATERNRYGRTDLHDPQRMRRRRQTLLHYFITKYELPQASVQHFLGWADAMEKGERLFLRLCSS